MCTVAEGAEIGHRGRDGTRRLVHDRDLAADHAEVRKHGATQNGHRGVRKALTRLDKVAVTGQKHFGSAS